METDFSGKLMIDGEDVSKLSIDRLAQIRNAKIGFIFQFHYLLGEFTCLRNVMIPALRLGLKSEEEIEALEATVAYLEKRKSIISAQLTICRWELTRKKQFRKLVD
jgi:ABC-type lipoprotein export system ATPase subunit